MRTLTVISSVVFVAACTSGSTSIHTSNGDHGGGNDGGGASGSGDGSGTGAGSGSCGTPGAQLVFAAMLDGQSAPDLYLIGPNDAQPTRLTNTPGAELWPAWSPDHKYIAFVRDAQLFVLNVQTGGQRLVADHVGRTREISGAAWSPDGLRLAYPYPRDPFLVDLGADGVIDESYATTLHFVNADGTNDVAYNEPAESGQPPGIGTRGGPAG